MSHRRSMILPAINESNRRLKIFGEKEKNSNRLIHTVRRSFLVRRVLEYLILRNEGMHVME
tara:strand:- start:1 stop:183 length:183 start_codon:yes stop_codon:yes gene_type:complete